MTGGVVALGGGALAEALAGFQREMPIVAKAHTAKVPTKAGGSYSYTYAGLADITAAAMPLLTAHGLAFSTCPRLNEGRYELVGRLLHISGEFLEGALPIAGATPQELGSSITYMRRYLFGCMTGLVTDDDDDGQLAQRGAAKKTAAKKATPPPLNEPPAEHNQPMTDATRAHMFALFGDLEIAEDDQLPGINHILGTDYPSRGRLTEAEAKQVIAVLKRKKEAAA